MKEQFIDEVFSKLAEEEVPDINGLFKERVNSLNLSMRQVENILTIDRKVLKNILDGTNKKVDVVSLIKIGSFIGFSFEESLKIFAASLPVEQIIEIQDARKRLFIIKNFDLKGLKKLNFLSDINDFSLIEQRINDFFGLQSIYDYGSQIGVAYSKAKKNYNNKMVDFWNQSAHGYFKKINNPNDYDRNRLIEVIPHIRPYSQDLENGLRIVARALYEIGVTVIFQPYVSTTQMRGATFIVNDKPCIVITNRNKNYATLWFALLHEIYHVLFEFDKVKKSVFHLTGELNLEFVDEEAANDFARQYFLSNEKSKYIFPYIDQPSIIKRYAMKNKIHPSFIYNFYCYDMEGRNEYWGMYKRYMPSTEISVKNLNSDIWQYSTLEEGVLSGMIKLKTKTD